MKDTYPMPEDGWVCFQITVQRYVQDTRVACP